MAPKGLPCHGGQSRDATRDLLREPVWLLCTSDHSIWYPVASPGCVGGTGGELGGTGGKGGCGGHDGEAGGDGGGVGNQETNSDSIGVFMKNTYRDTTKTSLNAAESTLGSSRSRCINPLVMKRKVRKMCSINARVNRNPHPARPLLRVCAAAKPSRAPCRIPAATSLDGKESAQSMLPNTIATSRSTCEKQDDSLAGASATSMYI